MEFGDILCVIGLQLVSSNETCYLTFIVAYCAGLQYTQAFWHATCLTHRMTVIAVRTACASFFHFFGTCALMCFLSARSRGSKGLPVMRGHK